MKIRQFLLILVVSSLFTACMTGHQAREQKLQEWLLAANRPVKVIKHPVNSHFSATRGSHYYTLMDSKGQVYLAKNVRFELPEVIE